MTEQPARRRLRLMLAVLAAIALVLTACGDDGTSPEDEARADGEALGESIAALGTTQVDELADGETVENQLATIEAAADELLAGRAEVLGAQVEELEAIATETVDTVTAALEAGNFGDAADALQTGLAEVETTIEGFAETNDSIVKAAWEGFETGLDADPE